MEEALNEFWELLDEHADIVSINFNNSAGKIGPEGVGSGTSAGTLQKLEWIKAGAGDRFSEIEIEIAAYFTVITDHSDVVANEFAKLLIYLLLRYLITHIV